MRGIMLPLNVIIPFELTKTEATKNSKLQTTKQARHMNMTINYKRCE